MVQDGKFRKEVGPEEREKSFSLKLKSSYVPPNCGIKIIPLLKKLCEFCVQARKHKNFPRELVKRKARDMPAFNSLILLIRTDPVF